MRGLDAKVFVRVTDTDAIVDMVKWCYDNIDQHNVRWDWSYVDDSDLNSDVNFYFKDPKIATLFALKWT